ncbi:hypothetical protein DAPK24_003930 [Pichia kluyveri]|uniref:Uncharacterized protein n=1 Tax=Pichia kluyveri TaxID=36015 RepID=A0AAV5QX22_PICKL|nr:hypothetical protein DAPK24_003930 [Pichia kluyveri]
MITHLFKRKEKCTGSEQMCQTGTDTTNTLAICLAVIIPVVLVILVVGVFMYKAYRRNKKEALDDDDPDFNVDNIILPDYEMSNKIYNPNINTNIVNGSTDSFGNPFNEKNIPNNNNNFANPSYPSSDPLVLPFGSSKEELDRYSKNLGLDYHEFNYPVRKMNSNQNSRRNSLSHSYSNSSLNLNQNNNNNNLKSNSPLKNINSDYNNNDNQSFTNKNFQQKSNIPPPLHVVGDDSNDEESSDDDSDDNSDEDSDDNSEEDSDEDSDDDSEDDEDEDEDEDDSSIVHNDLESKLEKTSNPFESKLDKSLDNSVSPITDDGELNFINSSKTTVNEIPDNTKVQNPLGLAVNSNIANDFDAKNSEIPDLGNDIPLSPEEEEQLNRMKSVYQVYFSRNGSKYIKKDAPVYGNNNNIEHNTENHNDNIIPKSGDNEYPDESVGLPPLPREQLEQIQNQNQSKNILQIPGAHNNDGEHDDDETDNNYRQSVSSSVYLPVNEHSVNNTTAGQFAHQQLGNLLPNQDDSNNYNNYGQNYQQYPDPYQQYQQYPDQYQQQYPPQQYPQQYQQQNYPPQQYQQQYPPQNYPNYPPQQSYGYASNQRSQQYSNSSRNLPKLEKLPLPHQLNKRTSTLESFTTFTADSHKNPVTHSAMPIDQNFNPINHVNWKTEQTADAPSPSQIRNSIVMFNPVGLSKNSTYVSKGTAKERVRKLNKFQNNDDGFIPPGSPVLNGPLYGFYDNVPERPHGAENLIPHSGSQLDLRKQMDNANV